MHESDTETLQIDRDRLGQWAVENGMKINPDKSKAVSFTRVRVKHLLFLFEDQKFPEAISCKYVGIILSIHLSCGDQVNYRVQKT